MHIVKELLSAEAGALFLLALEFTRRSVKAEGWMMGSRVFMVAGVFFAHLITLKDFFRAHQTAGAWTVFIAFALLVPFVCLSVGELVDRIPLEK